MLAFLSFDKNFYEPGLERKRAECAGLAYHWLVEVCPWMILFFVNRYFLNSITDSFPKDLSYKIYFQSVQRCFQ